MPFVPPSLSRLASIRCPVPTLRNATARVFSVSTPSLAKSLPPRRVIPDSELVENFLKGSGPGGQKINKTSSAVQLIHIPTGIVVKYQDTRSRELNRKRARRILQDRLEEREMGDEARTSVKRREMSRKKASAGKKSRRKYRALEGKSAEGEAGGEEGGEGAEGSLEVEVDEVEQAETRQRGPSASEGASKAAGG